MNRPSRAAPTADLFDVLSSGSPAAFATNADDRIVFWNRGAETLLGRKAVDAIGLPCFDVLKGRDVFGNRFCARSCPVASATRDGEPVNAYELSIEAAAGARTSIGVTIVTVGGGRPEGFTLIHLLHALDPTARVTALLNELGRNAPAGPRLSPLLPSAAPGPPPLTQREAEILQLVATGLQNKEIAHRLGISLATTRNHIHRILDKLEVHSKLEAVSLAFRMGWVVLGDRPAARTSPRLPS